MFARLGAFCARRYRLVLGGWIVLAVLGGVASGPVFAGLTTSDGGGSFESVQGWDILGDNSPYGRRVLGLVDDVTVRDAPVRQAVGAATADLGRIDGVARAVDGSTAPRAGLVATDGRAAVIVVDLDNHLGDRADGVAAAVETRIRRLATEVPGGATVKVGGPTEVADAANEQVRRDTEHAELTSLPATLLVLVVIFGGLVAAALPLIGALAAVAGAFVFLFGFSLVMDLDPNTVPVVTLLGLGISIDYALLAVNRFREERAAGVDVGTAITRTAATAGRTITYSGLTVAVCLSALFLFDNPVFRAIGAAGFAVVLVAVAVALTLVPALLAAFGTRIRPGQSRAGDHGFFARVAALTQRRPWPVVLGVTGLLLLAGLPLLDLRTQNGGAELLPESYEAVQVERNLAVRFPGGNTDPVIVVAATTPRRLDAYLAGADLPPGDVASVGRATAVGPDHAQAEIVPTGDTQGGAAQRLVHTLRDHRPDGFRTWVTGSAAVLVDFDAMVVHTLPWAFGLIAVAAFVLLFLMTGSIMVPVKALVMNTVSLGATFGALVWVFQDGHLADPLGFTSPGAIETWVPVIVFAFAFGLSMDYEVFLLSRIKELVDAGHRNDDAVRIGLQRSGRIITSAALLIVIVFLGFATGQMLGIKEMGFALAVAIVVDATLVRCLLVPATMTLLGAANWWAPAPLRRLHDRYGLRESGGQPP